MTSVQASYKNGGNGFHSDRTFVFQPESSSRHADIGEKVEVELVGSAVEQSRNGGALGRK